MRILLTNDDGIHAPGLTVLETIARELSDDVFVVAPESDQSGVAHSLSLSDPLRLREISPHHYAVKGTPTDCVIMGVRTIMADKRPDLVLSGVNRGQNVAEDVTYSGTIAGAMEGAMLGIPSIALSQAYAGVHGRPLIEWDSAETHAVPLIRKLLDAGIPPGGLVNVNFPALRRRRGQGDRLQPSGPPQRGADAGRAAAGRSRLPVFLADVPASRDPLRRRHRPCRPRRAEDFGDAAQARSHRRRIPVKIGEGVRDSATGRGIGRGLERVGGGRARPIHTGDARQGRQGHRAFARARARPARSLHAAAFRRHRRARHRAADRLRPDIAAALHRRRHDRRARTSSRRTRCAKSEPGRAIARLCSPSSRRRSCRSNGTRPWPWRPTRESGRSVCACRDPVGGRI